MSNSLNTTQIDLSTQIPTLVDASVSALPRGPLLIATTDATGLIFVLCLAALMMPLLL
jgi:hypothetical protein